MGRKRVIAVGVVVATVCVPLLWLLLRPSPTDLLADLVSDLRARGEPVTLAEMEPPLPPQEENGAWDIDALPPVPYPPGPEREWMETVAGPWNPTIVAPWEQNATPEQLEAARVFVASLAASYAGIDAAAEKAEIAWELDPSDLSDPMDASSRDMALQRDLQELLAVRAVVAATPSERLRAVRSSLALSARARVRGLIQHMACAGLFAGGCRSLRHSLEAARVDPAAARRDLTSLLETRWCARLPRMARGERAFILERFPHWLDGSIKSTMWGAPVEGTAAIGVKVGMALGQRPSHPLMGLPRLAIGYVHGMDRYLVPGATALDFFDPGSVPPSELDPITLTFAFACQRLVETDALAGLSQTALAAYAYRAETGTWPAAAADLERLLPHGALIDPFTDEPFELVRDGDALVLRAHPPEFLAGSVDEAVLEGYVWRLPPR